MIRFFFKHGPFYKRWIYPFIPPHNFVTGTLYKIELKVKTIMM